METDAPEAQELTNEKMSELTMLSDALKAKRKAVETLEEHLKLAKSDERDLSENKIPALMTEIGLTEIVLKTGGRVSIKEDLKISIGKKLMPAVLDFVRKEGDVGIIKNEIAILFGKGDEATADSCFTALDNKYPNVSRSATVNTATFKSMIKELIEQGVEVPFKELGIFDYRKTVIK